MIEPWVEEELAHPAAPVIAELMGTHIDRMADDDKFTLAGWVLALKDVLLDWPELGVHHAAKSLDRIRKKLAEAEAEARKLPERYLKRDASVSFPDRRLLPERIAALARDINAIERLIQRDAPRVPEGKRGPRHEPREPIARFAAEVYSAYVGQPIVSAHPDHTPKAGFSFLADGLIRAALPGLDHKPTSWYKPTVDAVTSITQKR